MRHGINTGKVLISLIRNRANINSFHANIKHSNAVATKPGAATGRATLQKALSLEQPSTSAASSSSLGTYSKKPMSNQVAKGRLKVQYASMRAG